MFPSHDMLAFFLFFSGIFRKDKKLLTVSLLVALYYASLIWEIFPEELFCRLDEPRRISWQAHLSGAVVGLSLALIFRKDKKLLTVSLLVALYYGSLIWGIFPEELFYRLDEPSRISWQAHLSGAVVGLSLALIFRKKHQEKKKKFIWEFPNYYSEKDNKLWQEYIEGHPEHFLEMPQKKKEEIWEHLDEIRKK